MNIADLTLYGRMAYGIKCCVALCKNKEDDIGNLEFIFYKLCEYTKTEHLADWEELIIPLMPEYVFEAIDKYGNAECREARCHSFHLDKCRVFCKHAKTCDLVKKTKRSANAEMAYRVYINTDNDVLAVIQYLCDIGRSELYGHPTDCKESELLLSSIIEVLCNNNIEIPSIEEFSFQTLDRTRPNMEYYGTKFDCTYVLAA